MAKKALDGEGINSATIFNVDPEKLVIVGHDTEHKSRGEHPMWDERAADPIADEDVRNVMFHGVLQTITVRKNGDAIEVVDGRQRTKWAREANRRLVEQGKVPLRVPCIVKRGTDSDMMGVMISANEIRHEDTPLNKARKLNDYLKTGRTEAEAAIQFGVNIATVKNWLRLLDLDESVQTAIERGDISAHAAKTLTKLPREEQRAELSRILETTPAPAPVEPEIEGATEANGDGEVPEQPAIPERKQRKATARAVQGATGGKVAPGKKEIRALLQAIADKDLNLTGEDPNALAMQILEWVLDGKTDRMDGFAEVIADLKKD